MRSSTEDCVLVRCHNVEFIALHANYITMCGGKIPLHILGKRHPNEQAW